MPNVSKFAPFFLAIVIAAWSAVALADPPSHAPAHGWRKKNDPYYVGYTGRHWDNDYGILSGRCNREKVATVVGGIIGGVVGSRVGDDDNRVIATIIGAAAGALIGNKIGSRLDDADRSCFGHALEVGRPGQVVTWENEQTGVKYQMALGSKDAGGRNACRDFTLLGISGKKKSYRRGTACQDNPGTWKINSTISS